MANDWIELSPYGMALMVVQLVPPLASLPPRILVAHGADDAEHGDALASLGFFREPSSGRWMHLGPLPADFTGAFLAAFPRASVIRDADLRRFSARISTAPASAPAADAAGADRANAPARRPAPEPEGPRFDVVMAESNPIGINRMGQRVYDGPHGRFCLDAEGRGRPVFESKNPAMQPGLFLRGDDPAQLAVAAEGFVEELSRGRVMRFEDLKRFASAAFGGEVADNDARLGSAHVAIEAALSRWLFRKGGKTLAETLHGAVRLQESHPYIGDLGRHVPGVRSPMPMPVSIAIQRAAGMDADMQGKRLVVSGAGTGFAHFPKGASLRVYAPDEAYAAQARATLAACGRPAEALASGDADYAGADLIVASLEPGLLGKARQFEGGLAVGRSDLAEAIDAVEARDPMGRAILVLREGDGPEARAEMERVRGWLGARYYVEGCADMPGALVAGRPEAPGMRVLVVGRRRPAALDTAPAAAMQRGEFNDFHGLWTWATQLVHARAKIESHAKDLEELAETPAGEADPNLLENSFQAPYVAMSGVGQASTMVPRNLEGATREALVRVARRHGDVDEWVANELGMTKEQLGERFSPEQVDAVALYMDAEERGRSVLVADQTGIGKGRSQPLDAKLLTPCGWKLMGDIRVGEPVIAVDGTPTPVTGIFPQGEIDIFEVTFSDDAKTRVSADHLWATLTRNQRHSRKTNPEGAFSEYKIRTTQELARTITRIHSIPLPSPVQFDERPVEVDPYLLGVSLRDACIRRYAVEPVMAEAGIVDAVSARLPRQVEARKVPGRDHDYAIDHVDGVAAATSCRGVSSPVVAGMRACGLSGVGAADKFVPDAYKFNSVAVRLAVLRGLMDTDGTATEHGPSVFTSVSRRLAEDVQFLVRSLGGLASIRPKVTKSKLAHNVYVTLPKLGLFGLALQRSRAGRLHGRCQERYVKSVVHVGKAAAQCISIAHPTRLYVTDDFVVTHNTLAAIMRRAALMGKKVLFVTERETNISDIWRDIRHIGADQDFAPLILNDGSEVIDEQTGEVTLRAPKRDYVLERMAAREWPAEHNLVIGTYSQFNKPGVPKRRRAAAPRAAAQADGAGQAAEEAAEQEAVPAPIQAEDDGTSPKSVWLRHALDADTIVVLDECHNAASGTSNASLNITAGLERAGGVVFSSATWAKNAKNMGIYAPLFPEGFDTTNLTEIMRKGGETMQETLSAMLVKDGVMIRREHDLSKCEFRVVRDNEVDEVTGENREIRNQRHMDALAPILAEMAYLSGDLGRRVDARNRQIEQNLMRRHNGDERQVRRRMKSLQVTRMSFGSPLYNLSRLFVCSLLVDKAADEAVAALLSDRKPVILVENTIQSVLEELAAAAARAGEEGGEAVGAAAPDFKDLMRRALNQMTKVTRGSANGRVTEDLAAPEPNAEATENLAARVAANLPRAIAAADEEGVEPDARHKETLVTIMLREADAMLAEGQEDAVAHAIERVRGIIANLPDDPTEAAPLARGLVELLPENPASVVRRIAAMIDELPDLPASAIDAVRERIEAKGRALHESGRLERPWIVEEITGRSMEYRDGRIARRPDIRRTDVKNRFNAGETDALIINVAGATGIDLHAGRRFRCQKQRVMIELQAPADITRQIQAYGRVNRFDQVIGPQILSLMAGLPMELRLVAMRNAKLRRLSANITSNREHSALIDNIPDLMNPVGDKVCTQYAEARPDLMRRLGLAVDDALKVEERNREAAEAGGAEDARDNDRFANTFLARLAMLSVAQQQQTLDELEAEYRATIEELDARGENPLKSKTIEGKVHLRDRTVFEGAEIDNPTSEFHRPVYAQRVIIEHPLEPLRGDQIGEEYERGLMAQGVDGILDYADRLERGKERILQGYIPMEMTVADALAEGNHRILNMVNDRTERLIKALREVGPGNTVKVTLDGVVEEVVVTRIVPPEPRYMHLASSYEVVIAAPGWGRPHTLKLQSVIADPAFEVGEGLRGDEAEAILKRFDDAMEGARMEFRTILTGNEWQAMNLSIQHRLGSMTNWEDVGGVRHRGVLVSKRHQSLDFLPISMRGPAMAAAALRTGINVYGNSDLHPGGLLVKRDQRNHAVFTVEMPARNSRKYGGIYDSPTVKRLVTQLNVAEEDAPPKLNVPAADLELVLGHLADAGTRLFVANKHREWSNAWMTQNYGAGPEAEAEAAAAVVAPVARAA
jgi:hypothetical protein